MTNAVGGVTIAPFRPGTERAILNLILPIQRDEFGIAITAADQPDLADIEGFYRTGAGEFWTAAVAGDIIGTIALKAFGEREGALRKMFVAPAWRGKAHGVGGALLDRLLDHARAQRLTTITLGTTAKFLGAHRFYEKNGFVEIAPDALPAGFPRASVDTKFYRLDLVPGAH